MIFTSTYTAFEVRLECNLSASLLEFKRGNKTCIYNYILNTYAKKFHLEFPCYVINYLFKKNSGISNMNYYYEEEKRNGTITTLFINSVRDLTVQHASPNTTLYKIISVAFVVLLYPLILLLLILSLL